MAGLEAAEVRDRRAERPGHLVEGPSQGGELVVAFLGELHLQRALLQPPCPLGHLTDGQQHGAGGSQPQEAGGHHEEARDGKQDGAELTEVVDDPAEGIEEVEVRATPTRSAANDQVGSVRHLGTHQGHP